MENLLDRCYELEEQFQYVGMLDFDADAVAYVSRSYFI